MTIAVGLLLMAYSVFLTSTYLKNFKDERPDLGGFGGDSIDD